MSETLSINKIDIRFQYLGILATFCVTFTDEKAVGHVFLRPCPLFHAVFGLEDTELKACKTKLRSLVFFCSNRTLWVHEYPQCMVWIKNEKIRYIPANPSFTRLKWGFRGYILHGHVVLMYVFTVSQESEIDHNI